MQSTLTRAITACTVIATAGIAVHLEKNEELAQADSSAEYGCQNPWSSDDICFAMDWRHQCPEEQAANGAGWIYWDVPD